jgi:hypothetical protein
MCIRLPCAYMLAGGAYGHFASVVLPLCAPVTDQLMKSPEQGGKLLGVALGWVNRLAHGRSKWAGLIYIG